MNKFLTVFFVFISIITNLNCNESKEDTIEVESNFITNRFFDKIQRNEYTQALDELLSQNKNIDLFDSSFVKLKEGYKDINEFSGKYIGNTLLKKRNINNVVAIYSYLVKYEKKFYRFVFTFYRPNKSTIIFKFAYDDLIILELEESLKMYS
jgi:hypothetical protein